MPRQDLERAAAPAEYRASRDPRPAAMTSEETYRSYLDAVRAGERGRAFDVVERARTAGLGLRAFYLEVFQPTLREIGRLWQENRVSVAEEHLATAITQSAMLRVYVAAEVPESTGPLLIAACADTEQHEIGLRMLCDFLDLDGWETVFLGSSVPADSLLAMISARAPDAVALSASIAPHLAQLRATIAAIRALELPRQPLILVGGRPFLDQPQLAASLGADLTASDAAEARALLVERFP